MTKKMQSHFVRMMDGDSSYSDADCGSSFAASNEWTYFVTTSHLTQQLTAPLTPVQSKTQQRLRRRAGNCVGARRYGLWASVHPSIGECMRRTRGGRDDSANVEKSISITTGSLSSFVVTSATFVVIVSTHAVVWLRVESTGPTDGPRSSHPPTANDKQQRHHHHHRHCFRTGQGRYDNGV